MLAELNNLELWGADIINAYLEAHTDEKLCIVAGPEFGDLQGHLLLINKALYGIRSAGARQHDRLFDVWSDMGFNPSKADPYIWMRLFKDESVYENIAVYMDDLALPMKNPAELCITLKEKYNFKLKGDGPMEFHLG